MSNLNLRLQPKQTRAFQSQATEILYGGAAGGGKSHLMRVAAIYWCAAIPGLQVYLFRKNYPDLWKNHMEGPTSFPAMLLPWILTKWVKINYSNNYIEFWNGSKIFLCHCQYETDVLKYQGAEIHVLMIDELTHFTESVYRFLRGRVRLGGLKVPPQFLGYFPRIILGANPGGPGHNWVKFGFIDSQPAMELVRQPKKEGGMLRQYIPARLADNQSLVTNDPDYEDRLEGLGNADLVRAMKEGDWNIVSGGMFNDLWNDAGRRLVHEIKPFDIPSSWFIDRSFDWGSSKPFACQWYAESDGTIAPNGITYPAGTIFVIAEDYGWDNKPNVGLKLTSKEVAERLKKTQASYTWGKRVSRGPADTQIWDVGAQGVSIHDDFRKAKFEWIKADKAPGTRRSGAQALRNRLKASLDLAQGEPGIFFFNNARNCIRTIPVLMRDDKDPDDVNTDGEDHNYDALRYRLSRKRPVFEQEEFLI